MSVLTHVKTKILPLILTAMVVIPAHADEANCKAVLHDCDTALRAEQKVNSLDKQIIDDQNKRFADQSTELKKEEFWRPMFLGLSVVVGVETAILLLKK
jgi:hypothetical protein